MMHQCRMGVYCEGPRTIPRGGGASGGPQNITYHPNVLYS